MRAALLVLLVVAAPAFADDQDEDALSLADKAPDEKTAPPSDWRILTEVAYQGSDLRNPVVPDRTERLSLDVRFDKSFASDMRVVFADRVDYRWFSPPRDEDAVNTLKESYLSWQPDSNRVVDAGRINARNGVATGYNPTDYFKVNAVRSVVSITPASLKENRLGSVMLRGQTLWASGSFAALYSPQLVEKQDSDAYSLDLGATNQKGRWLIAASQKIVDDLTPQFLVYGEEQRSPQLGVNLTNLFNDATIGYLEWSGGRGPSLLSQALGQPDDSAFRDRVATGLTYTAASKISFTLEYDYNSAALDASGWDQLSRGSVLAYVQYRRFVQAVQEPPTKKNIFLYANWQDAFILHLDVSLMQRRDVADRSRQSWAEARYHWDHVDLAVQYQINAGRAGSEFGALPEQATWQALVAYYF